MHTTTTGDRLSALILDGVNVVAAELSGGTLVTLSRGPLRTSRWHWEAPDALAHAIESWDAGYHDAPEDGQVPAMGDTEDIDPDAPVPYELTGLGREVLTDAPIGYALTDRAHEILNRVEV